jgi:hypothetical protein
VRTINYSMKAEELRLIHIQNRMGMSLRSMAKQWHLPFLMMWIPEKICSQLQDKS